jgi:hypothetical protein
MVNHPNRNQNDDLQAPPDLTRLKADLFDALEVLEGAAEIWIMDAEGQCLETIHIGRRKLTRAPRSAMRPLK